MLKQYAAVEQVRAAYITHKWVRFGVCAGIFSAGLLLAWISGGFPPWAWRFLVQVMPRVPALWEQRGLSVLLPLIGLVMLSFTILIAWGGLGLAGIRVVQHWLLERSELRRFEEEAQEAQELAGVGDIALVQTPIAVRQRARTIHEFDTLKFERGTAASSSRTETSLQENPARLLVATGLDAGIKRKGKPNEDSLFGFEDIRMYPSGARPVGLFVIADGMGGHENGQEASQLAIQALRETVLPALLHGPEDEIFMELLAEGVHRANLAVYSRNRQQQADMGTTLTTALIAGTTAYVANVGDSRTYLYRDSSGLSQITRDHSTVAKLLEAGAITLDEVYTHPKRNVIYRSLGRHASEEVDRFTVQLQPGDVLLLCSDGLWEMVRDPEIETIVKTSLPYPSQMSKMLIQAALNRGGADNISVIVVYIRKDSQ